jgi:hypothetical protein
MMTAVPTHQKVALGTMPTATWGEQEIKSRNNTYKSAVGLALATAFILVWLIGAVGVLGADGDPADLMYIGVFAVGIVGAIIARFQPRGMARAMLATAVTQMLVAVIALILGQQHLPYMSVYEILGLNGFFAGLFLGSARLFRKTC